MGNIQKANQVRLNHELLIWRGFTLSNGVWSYPDGVTVDNGVPYFPEDETACFKWFLTKLLDLDAGISIEYADTSVGDNAYVVINNAFRSWDTYERYAFHEKFGDVEFEATATTIALAICLAIQKLIRSK